MPNWFWLALVLGERLSRSLWYCLAYVAAIEYCMCAKFVDVAPQKSCRASELHALTYYMLVLHCSSPGGLCFLLLECVHGLPQAAVVLHLTLHHRQLLLLCTCFNSSVQGSSSDAVPVGNRFLRYHLRTLASEEQTPVRHPILPHTPCHEHLVT
jgi:hypothetical protein